MGEVESSTEIMKACWEHKINHYGAITERRNFYASRCDKHADSYIIGGPTHSRRRLKYVGRYPMNRVYDVRREDRGCHDARTGQDAFRKYINDINHVPEHYGGFFQRQNGGGGMSRCPLTRNQPGGGGCCYINKHGNHWHNWHNHGAPGGFNYACT